MASSAMIRGAGIIGRLALRPGTLQRCTNAGGRTIPLTARRKYRFAPATQPDSRHHRVGWRLSPMPLLGREQRSRLWLQFREHGERAGLTVVIRPVIGIPPPEFCTFLPRVGIESGRHMLVNDAANRYDAALKRFAIGGGQHVQLARAWLGKLL